MPPTDTSSPLGKHRQAKGYPTLAAAAEKLDLTRNYLNDVERGARLPGPGLVARLAQFLGVSEGWLRRTCSDLRLTYLRREMRELEAWRRG